ncbi:TatD family hydrolase [Fundidesulfovibrio magnetotacticus]|uniref:TatD family hydrolase n=1 Tax=Fundidesulfovibrio magnetotacticus TaxID=2730080 RepID=UPI0015662F01|nr:TatD family hydrolase [Fundidesulfovibrio magnetotacticus]
MAKQKEKPAPESLGLPCVGVETHAHLDYKRLDPEALPGLLERARSAGVARLGNVFLGVEAYCANAPILSAYPEVFFLLGVHPNDAGEADIRHVADMGDLFAGEPRLRAVGEIGLDFYWKDTPPDVQERFFREQLAMARELGRPVAVHSRDASAETLRVLDDSGIAGEQVLWHCFGGGPDLAVELIQRGYTVSIPGPVTYSKNEDLRRAVSILELDRLVIESDAPFLTPEPYRGRPNEPAYNVFTAQTVARIKGLETADLWRRTGDNARRFFGLD